MKCSGYSLENNQPYEPFEQPYKCMKIKAMMSVIFHLDSNEFFT